MNPIKSKSSLLRTAGVLLLVALCTTAFSQNAKPQWMTVIDNSPASMKSQLVSSSEESIKIHVQVPGFYTTTVSTPQGEAKVITVPSAVSTAHAGEPDVPMMGIPAIIGDQARMDVRVVEAKYKDFDNIAVAPSKGDFPRTIDPATVPYTYGDCYSKDAFFPADNAELYEPYILRSYRGQNIAVHPFVYNPVTKTLRVYYDLTVEMYKVDDNGKNPLTSRHSKVVMTDPDFKSVYGRHFINYEASQSKYTPVDEEGDLLIICYDSFISAMTDFVNWKKTRGVNTTIVGTSTAGTSYSAIKTYIQNQYNANNNLTHVLLVGDVAQIPGYSYSGGGSEYSGLGDNAYGQIVGNDIYNDVFIGRFSASNAAQVTTQVNRVITYERDLTTSATWLQLAEGISRKENGSGHNGEDDYQHMDNIRTDLLYYGYTTVYQRYANLTGYDGSSSTISSDINNGVGIINYTNHGQETAWGANSSGYIYYSNSHVNALTNENKLPFIFSVACLVGKYDHSSECFAETWMRATNNNNPTGAVGTVMSYISQPWIPPMWAQDEFIDILVGSYSNNIKHTWGGTAINGLMGIFDHYSTSESSAVGTYQAWILYGDPSMMLRTKTPQAMTVTHNGTLVPGTNSYTVNVSNGNGAVATITDANHNILGKATVSNGTATISFSGNLTPNEELTLCVFGYNKVTYLGTINVIATGEQFDITAKVNNTDWGSVEGAGTYYENANCTLTAVANHGYAFVNWDDGNTDNPRIITVTGNATYTAYFRQLEQHSITYNTQQNHGTISVSPTAAYAGDIVTLTATPDLGYSLDHWDVNTANGNVEVVNNQFVMPDCEVTISATFKSEPLTIADGTGTNSEIPFYGLYSDDNYQHTQTIYPASMLTNMQGCQITKLTYYLSSSVTKSYGSTFQVRLGTTTNTAFGSGTVNYISITDAPVYSGTLAVNGSTVEFDFSDNPYLYSGGNLVVDVRITALGSGYQSMSFYGESGSTYYSVKNRSTSSLPTTSGTGVSFMPKTTFAFTAPTTGPYISLAPNSATILPGFTQSLTATYGNVSETPTIIYTSSNNNIATVSGNGNTATVTAVAPGTATITATMNYEGTAYSATCAITVEAPSYCTPNPTSVDGKGITNLTFGSGDYTVNNSNSNGLPASSPYYADYTSMVGGYEPGETATVTITYSTGSSTVYSYGTLIWVDWNKNYEFEDSEIVYTGTSAQGSNGTPQVLTATFTVPANQAADNYRMRIAGADSYFDDYIGGSTSANHAPCFTSTYAVCHDYTLRVIPNSNCPTPTITDITATSNSATISTDSEASSFNVRYREYLENTPTTYDFEDGWQGWTTFQGTTTSPNSWMHSTEYVGYTSQGQIDLSSEGNNSSSGFMLSESYISATTSEGTAYGAVTPDNYLVSPQIRLGGSITFYAAARMSNYPAEKFSVLVSTTGNTSASDFTTTLLTVTLTSSTYSWNEYTVDLSAYSGMGYVAIRHYDCNDQHLLYIDDVTVNGPSIQWQSGNNLTITGLEPATTYEVQVQANCGAEEGVSAWSEVATFTTLGLLELADDDSGADVQNNSVLISENANVVTDVKLFGRTLYKDNAWNTICLPFDIDDLSGTQLEGATLKELDTENKYTMQESQFIIDNTNGTYQTGLSNDGTLYLFFKDAEDGISAGVPYIIKWASGDPIVPPTFSGVTINGDAPIPVTFTGGQFVGNYDAITIPIEGNSILYIGANNTLYYPKEKMTIGAFRAYFLLDNPATVRAFNLNFGDNRSSGITTTNYTNEDGVWYTVDGRKLLNAPKRKGVYIKNGAKVTIK